MPLGTTLVPSAEIQAGLACAATSRWINSNVPASGYVLIGVADQSSRLPVFGVPFQSSHSIFAGLSKLEPRGHNIESSMWKATAASLFLAMVNDSVMSRRI